MLLKMQFFVSDFPSLTADLVLAGEYETKIPPAGTYPSNGRRKTHILKWPNLFLPPSNPVNYF